MFECHAYSQSHSVEWNTLNKIANRGHFLFDRGFMEYHSDRFKDASLTIWRNGTLCAILPANLVDDTIYSHGGLTFGGLVAVGVSTNQVVEIFRGVFDYYRQRGVRRLIYRPPPWIYANVPTESDLFSLHYLGARLVHRELTSTVELPKRAPLSSRRRRGAQRARKAGVVITESNRWLDFWELLNEVLRSRHGKAPVHTIDEIEILAAKFPNEIRLYVALDVDKIVAGVVIFETLQVAHVQYIASGERGRELGALDQLIASLMDLYENRKRFFDFGISTENKGFVVNWGLLTQKEEFGGCPVVQDTFEVDLM